MPLHEQKLGLGCSLTQSSAPSQTKTGWKDCGNHTLFLFQHKFADETFPSQMAGTDVQFLQRPSLVSYLVHIGGLHLGATSDQCTEVRWANRDTEDRDMIRYVRKGNHADSKSGKQDIRLVWEIQEKLACLLKFLMETFAVQPRR